MKLAQNFIGCLDHGRFISIVSIVLSVLLAGCLASDGLNVDCHVFEDNPERVVEIAVAEDEQFTVSLCTLSNYGYHWSEADIDKSETVAEISHEYEPGHSPMGGVPGKEIWIFRAQKPGNAFISLEHTQPSGRNSRGVWTYRLAVTVEPGG